MCKIVIYLKIWFLDKRIRHSIKQMGPRVLWNRYLKKGRKSLTNKEISTILFCVNKYYNKFENICLIKSTVLAILLKSNHIIKLKLGVKNEKFYEYIKTVTNYTGEHVLHYHCWVTIDNKVLEIPFWEYMWDTIYTYEVK